METREITKRLKVQKNGPSTLIVRITDIARVLDIAEGDEVEVTVRKLHSSSEKEEEIA